MDNSQRREGKLHDDHAHLAIVLRFLSFSWQDSLIELAWLLFQCASLWRFLETGTLQHTIEKVRQKIRYLGIWKDVDTRRATQSLADNQHKALCPF